MKKLETFALKAEAEWNNGVEKNQDPYGFGVYRYAARWAHFMEREIANGKKLADVAGATSHEADDEGITGFMYGCAVSILARVWTHGEELRTWHNLKIQIGTEGERVNKSGGVLNPAILNIG